MNTLYVVGIGFPSLISLKSIELIAAADLVVGYTKYIEEIKHLIKPNRQIYTTGMRGEVSRVEYAVKKAQDGLNVCIVCSGDPSLYGMASLAIELGEGINVEVVPSVSAAFAASSILGAPVSDDLVCLSLSNHLTDWEIIKKRIDAVNYGDFVCAIYNPRSSERKTQLPYALNKFYEARGNLPVGVVWHAYRKDENSFVCYIKDIDVESIDMSTILIAGSSKTIIKSGKMLTPRGYLQK